MPEGEPHVSLPVYEKLDIPSFKSDLPKWAKWVSESSYTTWNTFLRELEEEHNSTWMLPSLLTNKSQVHQDEHMEELDTGSQETLLTHNQTPEVSFASNYQTSKCKALWGEPEQVPVVVSVIRAQYMVLSLYHSTIFFYHSDCCLMY